MLRALPTVTTHARPHAHDGAELPALIGIPPPTAGRVLVWDIENRPLTYWVPDRPTAEITAIAWCFEDTPERVECRTLEPPPNHETSARWMLFDFVDAYNQAEVVTGHFIRRHDIPIVQGALFEMGLPPLGKKKVSDTRLELRGWKDLPASQESLGAMMRLQSPKEHMSQADWREANRLTPAGIAETRRRVVGDVRQHLELRAALLARGLLRAPRMWRP